MQNVFFSFLQIIPVEYSKSHEMFFNLLLFFLGRWVPLPLTILLSQCTMANQKPAYPVYTGSTKTTLAMVPLAIPNG